MLKFCCFRTNLLVLLMCTLTDNANIFTPKMLDELALLPMPYIFVELLASRHIFSRNRTFRILVSI